MKATLVLTLIVICFHLHVRGQSNWNVLARARSIAYLMEPDYRLIPIQSVSTRHSNLTTQLLPYDTLLAYLIDSVKAEPYVERFAVISAMYIFKGDSLTYDSFSLEVLNSEFYIRYNLNLRKAKRDFEKFYGKTSPFVRLDFLTGILPFDTDFSWGKHGFVFLQLDATDWLKDKAGFDFRKYSNCLAAVVYDLVFERSNDFHHIDIGVSNNGKVIFQRSYDFKRDIAKWYDLSPEPFRPEQKKLLP